VHNYSHGYISSEAFERRLDVVIESSLHKDIVAQMSDLDSMPDETIKQCKEKQFGVTYHDDQADDSDLLVNIFGGSDRSGQWTVSKTMTSISIFGGADIDFTDARFTSPNITIHSYAIFGGDNIYVPEDVNVVSKVFCVFGGVSNKAPSIGSTRAPTITLKGLALFGGTDIRVKQTIKEKFVAFANQMKTVFDSRKSVD
jgi:hypothetical protein